MDVTRREALSLLGALTCGGLVNGADFFRPKMPSGRTYGDVAKRRNELYELLGDLPDRQRPISARTLSEEERDGYILEKLELVPIPPTSVHSQAEPRDLLGACKCP